VLFDLNESLLSQVGDPQTKPVPLEVKRTLTAWRIHHDIHVERGSSMRGPVVTQPTHSVAADGGNLAAVLHTLYTNDRDFRRRIDDGMIAGFGEDYETLKFPPAAAQRIQLAIQWKSCRDPHVGYELSDGTLRFLLLLTILSNPKPPPLIAIDEPEIGLHPSMLRVIAEFATEAAERTQVVISSHSAEFLDAFTSANPNVTVCQWENGETKLHQLPPGQLGPWLEKYRLGELFTSGELDALAAGPVDEIDDADARFAALPPLDETLPPDAGMDASAAHE
jgi:predicted ATPase